MATLEDDVGLTGTTSPNAPTSSLESDIGLSSRGGTDLDYHGPKDKPANMHSVTDEAEKITANIAKQVPRNLAVGLGKATDLPGQVFDMAFHPEGDESPTDIGTNVATGLSNKLEQAVPSLKPVDQGPIERIIGKGIEAAPTAIPFGPEALLPTMASGSASQTAKEMGGGPVAQTLAGLSPFVPSGAAATVRGIARGSSGAAMEENLANAKNAGINISAGQAAENPAVQGTETFSSKLPGGAPLRETRSSGLNQQTEEAVGNIVKKLAPDLNQRPPTPTAGGEAIQEGIRTRIKSLNTETTEAKEAMEKSVGGKDTPMAAPKLEAALSKVTGGTGVEAIDALATGAKTKAIAKTVAKVTDNPKVPQFTGEWTYNPKTGKSEPVTKTPTTDVGPQPEAQKAVLDQATPHTFDSLRTLRTLIGRGIKSTRDPGQQGQLKQLYGAISDDLSDGVRAKGPEAEGAFGLFDSVAKQNAATQKTLLKAIKEAGGPEAAFTAAMNGSKSGATKISPILQSLDAEGKNLFRATVLHRLGRAGGAVDAPFDANTFLTNWKGMSPEAKNVLFNTKEGWGAPGNLRSSLDSLSSTLDLLKKQGYVQSGFTKGVQQGVGGLHKGVGLLGALAILKEFGGTAEHLIAGNPGTAVAAAGLTGGTLAVNPILSRVLTNPKTVAWLAQATKAPKGAIPVLLNQLNQMGNKDPDAKDLATLIDQQGNK